MERTGGVEYQVENSEEEEEEEYNQVYPEEVEDIDDDEFEVGFFHLLHYFYLSSFTVV